MVKSVLEMLVDVTFRHSESEAESYNTMAEAFIVLWRNGIRTSAIAIHFSPVRSTFEIPSLEAWRARRSTDKWYWRRLQEHTSRSLQDVAFIRS